MQARRPSFFIMAVVALFPLFLTVGGVLLLWHVGPKLWFGLEARSWPQVPGTVTSASIQEVDVGPATPGSKRWFEVQLRYTYRAEGREFTGHRIGVWNERFQLLKARSIADTYLAHPSVQVHYDPAAPSNSLLDRDVGPGAWGMVAGGLAALALSTLLWIGFVRACRLKGPVQ